VLPTVQTRQVRDSSCTKTLRWFDKAKKIRGVVSLAVCDKLVAALSAGSRFHSTPPVRLFEKLLVTKQWCFPGTSRGQGDGYLALTMIVEAQHAGDITLYLMRQLPQVPHRYRQQIRLRRPRSSRSVFSLLPFDWSRSRRSLG